MPTSEQLEAQLLAILENIPHMIFVKSAEDLRFVRFNRAGEDLLGYGRETLIGKTDHDFFPKEEADFFTKKDRAVLASKTPVDIPEEPIETRLKGRRILHTKKIPLLDETGEPVLLLGISEDITDRIAAERALAEERRRAEELQRRFLERVFQAQEAERKKIARELHDETGQSLASVLVRLAAIEAAEDLHIVREQARAIRGIASDLMAEVERMSLGLHPQILDDIGLGAAISRLSNRFAREHGISVAVQALDEPSKVLPGPLAHAIYRLVQESLTNVAKHAEAKHVSIVLSHRGHFLRVLVEDDGRGFDPSTLSADSSGLGLRSMRERVGLAGGRVDIESAPGRGTTICAELPVRSDVEAQP